MTERLVGSVLAVVGLAGIALAQPVPPSIQPSVDWSQYPIIAMLLIVIGVLLWRFERHLERKDAAFVAAIAEHDSKTTGSLRELGSVVREMSASIGERDRRLIHHLTTAHTVDTVLAQAVLSLTKGGDGLTVDQVRKIVEDHVQAAVARRGVAD